MPDWLKRTLKTFLETFIGVIVTGIGAVLSGVDLSDIHSVWVALSPLIISGISAAVTAAWNYYLEHKANSFS